MTALPSRRPMRVLWICHFVPYPSTGHGALQRSHHLLLQAARQHEVHLVALDSAGSTATPAGRREAEDALGAFCASVALVPLGARGSRAARAAAAAASALGGPSYWERLFAVPEARRRVAALAARGEVDVVHLDAVFLADAIAGVPEIPLVLNHHNVESHLLEQRAERAGGARRAFFARQARRTARMEAALGARAACNLVVSDVDAARLRALVPGATTALVPNGVDVEFFRAAGRAAPVPGRLVWAGGMDWFPNRDAIRWFAESLWPALAADRPDRSATIIGRQPPPEVVRLAERDPRVTVLGFVDDVRPHIEAAEVYLCPIRVGGGTRLKVLDALAMERPLVGSAVGVEGLDLEDGRHYLRADDVAAIVDAVRRLEGDPALAARLAGAGRRFVEERYSWATIGEVLTGVYESARAGATLPV